MKKVYVSGPMAGLEDLNKRAFNFAELVLDVKGYQVINPVALGDELEETGTLDGMNESERYMAYLRHDLVHVPQCDSIYMLKGWEKSRGAMAEFTLAKLCDLEVLFEDSGREEC